MAATGAPALEMQIQGQLFHVPNRHHSKIRPARRCLADPCWRALYGISAALVAAAFCAPANAAGCAADSSEHRVALLELYTSEGCNSCPPADRWLNGLQDRGTGTSQVVPLAFHVDYWDYIGWKDRFAKPEFSQRQRLIASRNQSSFIYTPQFVLNGRDFRHARKQGGLEERLKAINAEAAGIRIRLEQTGRQNKVRVALRAHNADSTSAHVFLVLFQNDLSSEIKAGENVGKKLYHEFVVRELKGPLPVAPGASVERAFEFDLGALADPADLGFAVFAENAISGENLQAMAVPLCDRTAAAFTPGASIARADQEARVRHSATKPVN